MGVKLELDMRAADVTGIRERFKLAKIFARMLMHGRCEGSEPPPPRIAKALGHFGLWLGVFEPWL